MNAGTTTDEAIGCSAINKAFWRILPLIDLAIVALVMTGMLVRLRRLVRGRAMQPSAANA